MNFRPFWSYIRKFWTTVAPLLEPFSVTSETSQTKAAFSTAPQAKIEQELLLQSFSGYVYKELTQIKGLHIPIASSPE